MKQTVCQKRALEDVDGAADTLSKNQQKKRSRNPHKSFSSDKKCEFISTSHFKQKHSWLVNLTTFYLFVAKYLKCEQCGNPKVSSQLKLCGFHLMKTHETISILSNNTTTCIKEYIFLYTLVPVVLLINS